MRVAQVHVRAHWGGQPCARPRCACARLTATYTAPPSMPDAQIRAPYPLAHSPATPPPLPSPAGMRAAHVRDGAVLTRYLAWLEAAVQRGVDSRQPGCPPLAFALTEASAADVLDGEGAGGGAVGR